MNTAECQKAVWEYYRHYRRGLPWREEPFEAYRILVSEVMLQQTQVPRVIPKYQAFFEKFSSLEALARAPLAHVLREWSGLGYNRRAKYLHEAAIALMDRPEPWELSDLTRCKGIGHNTASAVVVYAYNQPLIFIETNIRTVFIYHFFNGQEKVADTEILPLLTSTLDHEHPRDFYYALMDYGTFLKRTIGNSSRQSHHYTKQSQFEGSLRQVRGEVLRQLMEGALPEHKLSKLVKDQRLHLALESLVKDGLLSEYDGQYSLA